MLYSIRCNKWIRSQFQSTKRGIKKIIYISGMPFIRQTDIKNKQNIIIFDNTRNHNRDLGIVNNEMNINDRS